MGGVLFSCEGTEYLVKVKAKNQTEVTTGKTCLGHSLKIVAIISKQIS